MAAPCRVAGLDYPWCVGVGGEGQRCFICTCVESAQILEGSQIPQRLVGPNVVVDSLPLLERLVQRNDLQVVRVDFIELLGMGPLGPLHMAIELG